MLAAPLTEPPSASLAFAHIKFLDRFDSAQTAENRNSAMLVVSGLMIYKPPSTAQNGLQLLGKFMSSVLVSSVQSHEMKKRTLEFHQIESEDRHAASRDVASVPVGDSLDVDLSNSAFVMSDKPNTMFNSTNRHVPNV